MSCFVNKNITGLDNVASTLNEDLKTIFPKSIDSDFGISSHYASVLSKDGSFKNSFPVDWETKEGQDYINKNYPGTLGEQGEPKLYVNKIGLAYFKIPGGMQKLNSANISENERFESIKSLMASYVENNSEDLSSFIRNSSKKNIGEVNMNMMDLMDEQQAAQSLYRQKGVMDSDKQMLSEKIGNINSQLQDLQDNVAFLTSVVRNDYLLDILHHDVKIALENSKIAYNDDVHERENDEANASIELGHLTPSNETNPQNNVPAEILQVMSTISKKKNTYDKEGAVTGKEDVLSSLMPLLPYTHDYSDVFKEVQKVLNNLFAARVILKPSEVAKLKGQDLKDFKSSLRNTNLYNVMISKLKEYAASTDSDIAGEFVSKIEALVDSKKSEIDKNDIRSKLVKSFHKSKSSNVMHTTSFSQLQFGTNAGRNIINLNKIDVSDEETRVAKLTSEMVTKALIYLSSKKGDNQETYLIKEKQKATKGKDFKEIKSGLRNYLYGMYGMVLTDNTVSNLITAINKNSEGKEGRSKVEEFLNKLSLMTDLGYNKSKVITDNQAKYLKLKKGNYTLRNLASDFFKLSAREKDTIIDNFTVNGGTETAFGLISRLEYNNSPSSADSSSSFGSKKVWLYSFMSKLQKDVIRWKSGDTEQLDNLKDTGNGLVDFLLAKDITGRYDTRLSQKRIANVNVKNNMELRRQMDANPTMFADLTEEDLIIMVFSNLYENKKEEYVQREQGGASQIGANQTLRKKIEGKNTAGEYMNLMNGDKSSTNSLSGILKGDSEVELDENKDVVSIGSYATRRIRDIFDGELNKMQKSQVIIEEYLNIKSNEKGLSKDENSAKTKEMKLSFAMKNLIPGWHYSLDKGRNIVNDEQGITESEFSKGRYLDFGFLNGFYLEHKDKIDNYYFEKPNVSKIKKVFASRKGYSAEDINIDRYIDQYVSGIVNDEAKELVSMTGASASKEYDEDEGMIYHDRKGLFDIQTNVMHEGYDLNPMQTAADFSLNYMLHSIDVFNLMNGELGMYKQPKTGAMNMMDPLKRTSAINADGLYPMNNDPLTVDHYLPFGEKEMFINGKINPKAVAYYKSSKTIFAAIDSQEYDQSHYGDSIQKIIYENGKKNVITLSGEVADGQSYSHPEMLYNFHERIYGISEKEKQLHTELMDRNTVPTKEHFDFLRKLGGSNESAKLQSFSVLKNESGTILPFFWKSSVIPLYPSLTKGFPIDELRKAMVAQNIGVVGNQTAFKTTTHQATGVFNENSADNQLGPIKSAMDIGLNPFEVDTDDIKIQVELKSKGEHEAVAGVQLLRNVIANMNLDSKEKAYFSEGKYITAKQMLASYDSNIKNVIQLELNTFLKKIDYKGTGDFDETLFRRIITDQLGDLDYDVKELLEDVNMPLETIPGMSSRIFPIISSYILKQVAKPKTNGSAMIQVSAAGFNGATINSSNSILFNENTSLKPPRPTTYEDHVRRLMSNKESGALVADFDAKIEEYNSSLSKGAKAFDLKKSPIYFAEDSNNPEQISFVKKEGYQGRIEDGQIMIPFSSIFEKSRMSWEEFSELATKRDENGVIIGLDQDILKNIMGYRIPNQSMSSNDSFEVVGILHESIGDSAIIYHEITSKTGSDFDIDKMTLMMPYFKTILKTVSEESLSEKNKATLYNSIKNNRVHEMMTTYKYQSIKDVVDVLSKNDMFDKYVKKNKLKTKSEDQIVESLVKDKELIEDFFEKDERKGIAYRRKEYSLKDVLHDLYDSEKKQSNAVDKDLKQAGFQPRKRLVAERFEYINDGSKKGLQNKLIRSISDILHSATTYDDLISPLDGTHIKSSINKVRYIYSLASEENGAEKIKKLEELMSYKEDVINITSELSVDKENENLKGQLKTAEAKVKAGEALVADYIKKVSKGLLANMMPKYLAKSRVDMLMAKGLTATMANHMTNIPVTQINKVFLKYNLGLGSNTLSRTHIIGKEGLDDFKITKMVSYLMNASVDAAKDNYIIEGNYNRYTSGAAMLLVRLGIDPEDVSKIMLHPLIVELSKEKIGSISKVANISSTYTNSALNELSKDFVVKMNNETNPLVFTPQSFVQNVIDKTEVIDPSKSTGLTDDEILGFWNLAVTIGKDLNDLIKLSKPDSNGFGKNTSEAHSVSNLHDIAPGNAFAFFNEKGELIPGGSVYNTQSTGIHDFTTQGLVEYDNEGNFESGMGGLYISAVSNIAISLVNELTKTKLIERSEGFMSLMNQMMINLGQGYTNKKEKLKKLAGDLYPYVLSTSGHEIYNFSKEDVADMLEKLPKDILFLKGNADYAGNKFLSEINVDESRGFISFNNVSSYSDLTKISLKDSSNTLYNNNDLLYPDSTDEIENKKTIKEVMERLVKYSYFTTGFRPSSYSFANYLPKQYFSESNHGEAIKKLLNDLNDGTTYAKNNLEKAMLFIATNRPKDEFVYKKITGKNISIVSGKQVKKSVLKKASYEDPDTGELKFYPFVFTSKKTITLNFALTDVENEIPTYSKMNVMTYTSKADFNSKLDDNAETILKNREYDEANREVEDEEDVYEEKTRKLTKKGKVNRLVLFNPGMASNLSVFGNESDSKLVLERGDFNLHMKNNKVLFDMNPSEESKFIEKEKALIEQKEYISEDFKSNKDVANFIQQSIDNKLILNDLEIKELEDNIDYFYSQDKNAHFKQKAKNLLQKKKGCN